MSEPSTGLLMISPLYSGRSASSLSKSLMPHFIAIVASFCFQYSISSTAHTATKMAKNSTGIVSTLHSMNTSHAIAKPAIAR